MLKPTARTNPPPVTTRLHAEVRGGTQGVQRNTTRRPQGAQHAELRTLASDPAVGTALEQFNEAANDYRERREQPSYKQLQDLHDNAKALHGALENAERGCAGKSGLMREACNFALLDLPQVTTTNPAVLQTRLAHLDEAVAGYCAGGRSPAEFPALHAAINSYLEALDAQPLRNRDGSVRTPESIHEKAREKMQAKEQAPAARSTLERFNQTALRNKYTVKLQSQFRGRQVRKQLEVKAVTPGITHVRLNADAAFFKRMGVEGMNTRYGPKQVDYLAIDRQGYYTYAAGANKIVHHDKPAAKMHSILTTSQPGEGARAYINASFYNVARYASRRSPSHATIGMAQVAGQKPMPAISPPPGYREDYRKITLDNGSYVTVAPQLSQKGVPAFPSSKLRNQKYQFDKVPNRPGMLGHASDPNPRSAISLPGPAQQSEHPYKTDRTRMAIVRSETRGKFSNSMTMSELSLFMAFLDGLNANPGNSYNLDGGGSTTMGVFDATGRRIWHESQEATGSAANFIAAVGIPAGTEGPGPAESSQQAQAERSQRQAR